MVIIVRRYSIAAALISAVAAIGWLVFMFGGGLTAATNMELSDVNAKVVSDAMDQYRIAQKSGTPMDVCVQAEMVSAAFLQAKDEPGYALAKAREKADCEKAGVGSAG